MKRSMPCPFCDIVNGYYKYAGVDEPIAENENYLAIASIGAIIEGWTLVLPKEHACSMKFEYAKDSFREISSQIIPKLYQSYGELICFEHGSNKQGSPTGCGIDHAHIHFVPFKDSLNSEIKTSNLNWESSKPSEIVSKVSNNEYLFYSELGHNTEWLDAVGQLSVLQEPVSQFFRKRIGEHLGNANMSDYKAFPFLSNAEQTRNTLINHYS